LRENQWRSIVEGVSITHYAGSQDFLDVAIGNWFGIWRFFSENWIVLTVQLLSLLASSSIKR